ncbi:VOC family protein [Salinarimonas ramus]|uniref:Glyoxalase n=1 Tax=Salinarimonas ramus TaxID=690164 RepID=A0A917QK58_9HYPH|nr:VOC family protein [Salinarimonas ramus]GGK53103.1 glyoxalase [Salinarimonas ramus]
MSQETIDKRGTLNHIRLTVSDIPHAERFYTPIAAHMGYRLVERSETRLSFAGMTGYGNLHFLILSVSRGPEAHPHDRYSPGLHHIAWNAVSRADVDAMYALLLEHGVTILDPPADYDYEPGYYAVFFADPDGMKLEYVYVPAAGSAVYLELFEALGPNPLARVQRS